MGFFKTISFIEVISLTLYKTIKDRISNLHKKSDTMEESGITYEKYVNRLENIVFDHIAIKLATYKGFSESLQSNFDETVRTFPLLYFIVESLQVDCVLTITKLMEEKSGKNLYNFLNFIDSNLKKINKKYPTLTPDIISRNRLEIETVSDQLARIKTQRDKYYAHSDNPYFFEPNKLLTDFPDTYNDLVAIIRVLQGILSSHIQILKGHIRVCMSDFAYLNTFRTIDLLKQANDDWIKKYRPDEMP
jgi:hypothetical protein